MDNRNEYRDRPLLFDVFYRSVFVFKILIIIVLLVTIIIWPEVITIVVALVVGVVMLAFSGIRDFFRD